MPDWLMAFLKIAGMFMVMLVGWWARRGCYLGPEAISGLSRLVVDVALPALILEQMLNTVSVETLRDGWHVPLLAVVTMAVGQGGGLVVARLFAAPHQRGTATFLVSIPNWVYLPLPIAAALHGPDGQLTVLLFNVGGLVMLWTMGVWTVKGGRPDLASVKPLLTNPGLLATFGGILLALVFPWLRQADAFAPSSAALHVAAGAVLQSVRMIGSITIPVSLLITGAQLAGWDGASRTSWRALTGVLVGRLVLTPLCLVAVIMLAAACGWTLSRQTLGVVVLIAAMPVAVNCGVFAERFGGDSELASRGIFFSTLLSIFTAPAVIYLVQYL